MKVKTPLVASGPDWTASGAMISSVVPLRSFHSSVPSPRYIRAPTRKRLSVTLGREPASRREGAGVGIVGLRAAILEEEREGIVVHLPFRLGLPQPGGEALIDGPLFAASERLYFAIGVQERALEPDVGRVVVAAGRAHEPGIDVGRVEANAGTAECLVQRGVIAELPVERERARVVLAFAAEHRVTRCRRAHVANAGERAPQIATGIAPADVAGDQVVERREV